MSLLQASVYAHRIIVAADTATDWRSLEAKGRVGLGFASKMAVVPHLPAIMAVRGELNLLQTLSGGMQMVASFDEWVRDFVETVERIRELVGTTNPVIRSALDAEAELILAGWSARARRLRAFHAGKPAGGVFTLTEVYGEAWAPLPHADDATRLDPQTTEDRVALARLQAERIRAESDGVAGGDLTIASLSRNAVSVEVVRDFMGDAAGTPRIGGKALAAVSDSGEAFRGCVGRWRAVRINGQICTLNEKAPALRRGPVSGAWCR